MNNIKFNEYEIKMAVSSNEFHRSYLLNIRILSVIILVNYWLIFLGIHNYSGETDAVWYQRSGSLIVFLSLLSEYFHLKIQEMVTNKLINYGDGRYMTRMQYFKNKNLPANHSDPTFNLFYSPQILFCALAGTVIWGYGDIFYKYL